MINPKILLILSRQEESEKLQAAIKDALKQYNAEVFSVYDAMEGITKYRELLPTVSIIDAEVPMLNGFSLISIMRDIYPKSLMYVVMRQNTSLIGTKVDYFFCAPLDYGQIIAQLNYVFEKESMAESHLVQLEKAKLEQKRILPQPLVTDSFKVDYIYSPFNELSGDYLDYWFGQDQRGLYGFLFDCTGHDINAYSQVLEIRSLFHIHLRIYQMNKMVPQLDRLMRDVNEELFRLHNEYVACCAAVVFYIEFETMQLYYCSAGIPNFFIKKIGAAEYEEVEMSNYLIGYLPDAEFEEKKLPLENVSEIIFSSDGFSELLYKSANNLTKAKHDDVSAIFIKLINTRECAHYGHKLKEA